MLLFKPHKQGDMFSVSSIWPFSQVAISINDASWVVSTSRYPIPTLLRLLSFQLKQGLPDLRAPGSLLTIPFLLFLKSR